MRAACHLPNRLAPAPSIALQSLTLRQRILRWICIIAVLCGQIGLPNLSSFVAASMSGPQPPANSDAGCQCPPTLRRIGRCCCAAKGKTAQPSCCAKKKSCRKDASDKKKSELVVGKHCPCDHRGDVDGYRCDDPRVLPTATIAIAVASLVPSRALIDSCTCGELLPPPVPPPEPTLS